jgi:hypothetical protein
MRFALVLATRLATTSAFVFLPKVSHAIVPTTARFADQACASASSTITTHAKMTNRETEAPVYSYHMHVMWRGVADGGKPDDEKVALSLLREFITENISYFSSDDVEAHMKGYTAERKKDKFVVGVGNPLLGMEEVLTLDNMPEISPEGKVIKNPRGPFYWIADKKDPERRIHVADYAIYIPVIEDSTKNRILLDHTTRWWRRRLQETAKERGCDTITILTHPNTGQLFYDHTDWLVWWSSDFDYQFMTAVEGGDLSVFNEGRAEYYLQNIGVFLKD